MQNLKTFSRTKALASWITKLNFVCYASTPIYSVDIYDGSFEAEVAALDYDYRQKYLQMKKFERFWNGQYWSITPGKMDPPRIVDMSSSRHRLSTFALEIELASQAACSKYVVVCHAHLYAALIELALICQVRIT